MSSLGEIGETIIQAFKDIIGAFVDMLMAIPNAITGVFEGWADVVGGTWYGPIIAGITIIAFVLIVYAGFRIKEIFFE
ncbi:MAG: hypothetical protein ACOC53_05400 [Candidatus Saliniplasma sp.]